MQTLFQKFTSRKFLLAAVAAAIVFLDSIFQFNLAPEQRIALVSTIVAFIAGETVLDNQSIKVNAEFSKRLAQAQLMSLYEELSRQDLSPADLENAPENYNPQYPGSFADNDPTPV